MYRTGFRVIGRATATWLSYVLLGWGLMYLVGAIERGLIGDYAFDFIVNLPAIIGFALPFVLFPAAVAWGDYCYASGIRRLAPALVVGGAAGALTLVLVYGVHANVYPVYCDVVGVCETGGGPDAWIATTVRYSVLFALLSPINALLGVLIAWTTAHVQPPGRMRFERWAMAVLLWLSMYVLNDILSRSATVESFGLLATRLIPLGVPVLASTVLVWVFRKRGYHG
ncbi:MAG: hypothetical protein ACR2QM_18350 [Longimicrobiales bacterium]